MIIVAIVAAVIIIMPLKIIGSGFIPTDDALRHVAKAISERSWNDVLVLRNGIKMDDHPGYHALLGFIHRITKFTSYELLFFSIISLFIIFCMIPVLFTKRPEAWLASLFIMALTYFPFITRLLFARPYIITMATLMILCFLWPRLKDDKVPYGTMSLITVLMAVSTWISCSWYLLILIIPCFVLAREKRAAIRISICALTGILLGASLTGNPVLFISQNAVHAFLAFNKHALPRTLVTEFRPFGGSFLTVIAVVLLLSWRRMRMAWDIKRIDNPVFILAVLGWALGFFVARFWLDWGIPALLVWMTQEFEESFSAYIPEYSGRRLLLTMVLAAILYASITNDIDDRWSVQQADEYMFQDSKVKDDWMPDPGGIIYSDDTRIFYLTFFKKPYAPWRYLVGFEPALMPQNDLDVYIDIRLKRGAPWSFLPWIKKMKPEDRLIIIHEPKHAPEIPELEWRYLGSGFWSGRLRKI